MNCGLFLVVSPVPVPPTSNTTQALLGRATGAPLQQNSLDKINHSFAVIKEQSDTLPTEFGLQQRV